MGFARRDVVADPYALFASGDGIGLNLCIKEAAVDKSLFQLTGRGIGEFPAVYDRCLSYVAQPSVIPFGCVFA